MTRIEFQQFCNVVGDEIEKLLPDILKIREEFNTANGNCVLCMMNAAGDTVVRMYGENPIRQRQVAQIATKKALQVWLTGYATSVYEELVFTKKIEPSQFGIPHPEFIGWMGGLEAKMLDGERLVLAFSGVRGEQDVGILRTASANLKTFSIEDFT